MSRLIDDLNTLHDGFVEAINIAVADNDLDRAYRLAAEYDEEAIEMIAAREGRTHMLPLRRPVHADSGLRALVRRLTRHRAAGRDDSDEDDDQEYGDHGQGARHRQTEPERRQRLVSSHRALHAGPAQERAHAHQAAEHDQAHGQRRPECVRTVDRERVQGDTAGEHCQRGPHPRQERPLVCQREARVGLVALVVHPARLPRRHAHIVPHACLTPRATPPPGRWPSRAAR
jgi:hypothetical protein